MAQRFPDISLEDSERLERLFWLVAHKQSIEKMENFTEANDLSQFVNSRDKYGNTLLHRIAGTYDVQKAELLCEKYNLVPSVNSMGGGGLKPLDLAVFIGNFEIVKLLTMKYKNDYTTDFVSCYGSILHMSVSDNNLEMTKFLSENYELSHFDNSKDDEGMTPLDWAFKRNNLEMVKILIEF